MNLWEQSHVEDFTHVNTADQEGGYTQGRHAGEKAATHGARFG
jgi:hypothetical protein